MTIAASLMLPPFSGTVSQQQGYVHGGISGALGDTAGGYAAMMMLPESSEVHAHPTRCTRL